MTWYISNLKVLIPLNNKNVATEIEKINATFRKAE